ncbi:MAG: antibiotic biosynthesis monooxygenase family protein [Gemmatimonadota bacterium]
MGEALPDIGRTRQPAAMYLVVWQYDVDPAQAARFEQYYGPAGAWAALFRRARGFLGLELYRETSIPGRYLTIDRWESLTALELFRHQFANEYAALDAACETMTFSERKLFETGE